MRRIVTVASLCVAVLVVALMTACGAPKPEAPTPQVAPPALLKAGVLKAGVDLSTPPFAGTDNGRKAGIDIDVAKALASQLGLKATFVDVKPSEAASALAQGKVDVVMSVPYDAALTELSLAGTYLDDAPAFWVAVEGTKSVEPSLTLDNVESPVIAAQQGSPAFWAIRSEYGSDTLEPYDSLRAALESLAAGEVPLVAGDALVGAYIARDLPSIRFAGQLAPATPLSVAVKPDNVALGDAVRSALDQLAADGVFDQVLRTWAGDTLPALDGATAPVSGEESATP